MNLDGTRLVFKRDRSSMDPTTWILPVTAALAGAGALQATSLAIVFLSVDADIGRLIELIAAAAPPG